MTACEPDPVAGAEVERVGVRHRRRLGGVQRRDVARVADAIAGVHDAPGEVDALVRVPELRAGQPPTSLEDVAGASPPRPPRPRSRRCCAPGRRRAGAAPSRAAAGRPTARHDAQLEQAELRVGELRGDALERIVRPASSASSSRKKSRSPTRMRNAGVAAAGDADVTRAARRRARRPAVRSAPSRFRRRRRRLRRRAGAAASRAPAAARPAAGPGVRTTQAKLRSSPAQRSRLEVRIASRWPAAVRAATGSSATSSTRVPARSPAIASTIAAASASKRELDRHERAEEGQVPERAAEPPQQRLRAARRPPRCPPRAACRTPPARRAPARSPL